MGVIYTCIFENIFKNWASLVAQMVKDLPVMQQKSLHQNDPWRRAQQPTPVFLPGESDEQMSLSRNSSWGRKESDTIKQ